MKKTIQNKIEQLLSKEYHCSPEELKKSGTVYSIKPDAERPYIKILAYKNCVLVCTSKDWYTKVKTLLLNRSKDEIFELPFVVWADNTLYSGYFRRWLCGKWVYGPRLRLQVY